MRLWHEDLIRKLPRQQLLGQHRECCALRGNGWGKRHSTVNYVFDYEPFLLYKYHKLIMDEMTARGYNVSEEWLDTDLKEVKISSPIYKEHNDSYYMECINNLAEKGIEI